MCSGFKLLCRQKAFISPVYPRYSAVDIVQMLNPDLRDVSMAVRRRTNENGSIYTNTEFTMAVARVPRNIRLLGYSYPLAQAISSPRRCFTCQRFRHVSNQCRSSQPIGAFCPEQHRTDSCPDRLTSAFGSNCCGDHVAFSWECPVYQYEFKVNEYYYWNFCEFGEVELGLRERRLLKLGHRLEADMERISLSDPPSALREIDLGLSAFVSLSSAPDSVLVVLGLCLSSVVPWSRILAPWRAPCVF